MLSFCSMPPKLILWCPSLFIFYFLCSGHCTGRGENCVTWRSPGKVPQPCKEETVCRLTPAEFGCPARLLESSAPLISVTCQGPHPCSALTREPPAFSKDKQ